MDAINLATMGVDRGHAAKAAAAHGRPMIAILARDDDALFGLALDLPVAAHKADVCVVRLRPRTRKEGVVHALGRDLGQFGGQRDGGNMGGLEKGVVIAQLVHLPFGNIAQLRTAIADVDAPQPGHAVDDLLAFAVGQIDALGRFDDPRALGGKAIGIGEGVHVVGGIQLLQLGRRHVVGDHVHALSLRSNGPRVTMSNGPLVAEYDQRSLRSRNLIKF
jgi:hypothetical protein